MDERDKRDLIEAFQKALRGDGAFRGYTPSKTTKASKVLDKLHSARHSTFGKAVEGATSSIKLMHGNLDDFAYSLHSVAKLIPAILGGGILDELIKGTAGLVKSYTRMANAGQMFGGSMFTMGEQAGAAGLSLEDFTKMIEKHSETAAFMNNMQGSTAHTLGDLQMEVRKNLKPMQFFGMSVSQMSDATADYADVLRQTGNLALLGNKQGGEIVADLVKNASAYSELTGKTRDELMKAVISASQQPNTLLRQSIEHMGKNETERFNQVLVGLAAAGGEKQSAYFSQMYGTGGQTQFTELGQAFNETLPQLNNLLAPLQAITKNPKSTPEEIDRAMMKYNQQAQKMIADNFGVLRTLKTGSSEMVLELGAKLSSNIALIESMGEKAYLLKLKRDREQGVIADAWTKDLLNLENNFNIASGSFRQGFYHSLKTIADTIMPDQGSDEMMKQFNELMKHFGEVMGGALGTLIKVFTNFDIGSGGAGSAFTRGAEALNRWLSTWTDSATTQWAKDIYKVFDDLKKGVVWLWCTLTSDKFKQGIRDVRDFIIWLGEKAAWLMGKAVSTEDTAHKGLTATGMSDGTAYLVEFAGAFVLWKGAKAVIWAVMKKAAGLLIRGVGDVVVGAATAALGEGAIAAMIAAATTAAIASAVALAVGAASVGAWKGAVKSGSDVGDAAQMGFRGNHFDENMNPIDFINDKTGETMTIMDLWKKQDEKKKHDVATAAPAEQKKADAAVDAATTTLDDTSDTAEKTHSAISDLVILAQRTNDILMAMLKIETDQNTSSAAKFMGAKASSGG